MNTIPLPAFVLLLLALACIMIGVAAGPLVRSTLQARAARERAKRAQRTKRAGSPVWFFKTHRFVAIINGREVALGAVRFHYGLQPCVELVRGVAAGRRSLAAIVEEAMGPNGIAISLHVYDVGEGGPGSSTRIVNVIAKRARATVADLDTASDEVWTERVMLHAVTVKDEDGRELDTDLQRKVVEVYDPKAALVPAGRERFDPVTPPADPHMGIG